MKNRFEGRDYAEALSAAFLLVKRRQRGDTITHRELEQASGLKYGSREYRYLVRCLLVKVREDCGIVLFSERHDGVGYKLATIEEQVTKIPRRRQRRATRQLYRGNRELEVLSGEILTEHERRLREMQMDHLQANRNAILRRMREQGTASTIAPLPIPARVLDAMNGVD